MCFFSSIWGTLFQLAINLFEIRNVDGALALNDTALSSLVWPEVTYNHMNTFNDCSLFLWEHL
jgi:hypothetical protein